MNNKIIDGVLGGLAGGVVFGIMMTAMGKIPMIAALVGSDSSAIGWLVHLVISVAAGLLFVWLLGDLATSYGGGAGYGVLYGFVWWILGPLLIMPVLLGMGPQFGNMFAIDNLMSLAGHLVFGLLLGLTYVAALSAKMANV